MRYELTTARTLCDRRRELEQSMAVGIKKFFFDKTALTQLNREKNSGVNIAPTRIMLLSKDSAAFFPSVSNTQTQLQLPPDVAFCALSSAGIVT